MSRQSRQKRRETRQREARELGARLGPLLWVNSGLRSEG